MIANVLGGRQLMTYAIYFVQWVYWRMNWNLPADFAIDECREAGTLKSVQSLYIVIETSKDALLCI